MVYAHDLTFLSYLLTSPSFILCSTSLLSFFLAVSSSFALLCPSSLPYMLFVFFFFLPSYFVAFLPAVVHLIPLTTFFVSSLRPSLFPPLPLMPPTSSLPSYSSLIHPPSSSFTPTLHPLLHCPSLPHLNLIYINKLHLIVTSPERVEDCGAATKGEKKTRKKADRHT